MPAGLGTLFVGLLLIVLAFVEGDSVWKSAHQILFGLFGCGSFVLGAAVCYLAILYTRGEDLLPHIAKLVLGPTHKLHPKWFRVPLETQHEEVNTLLAMIITTTPGTVSAGIDQDRGDILVHALSAEDAEAEIQSIKKRYEKPLMQIFGVDSGERS